MNAQKDIFSAFQEGSEQLTVQPSPQAWRKLESRLEVGQKSNGRVVMLRWLTAAAAMFVLVVGMFYIGKLSGSQSMAFDNEPMPTQLEDLVNTDGCKPYCLLIKERKALPAYYANPVRK
ncbi:MAG: hypothetical protein IPM82_01390 [Saprospiraceae bacterium]|nr:hypothetical protein [Saprospiraceae bacterium]